MAWMVTEGAGLRLGSQEWRAWSDIAVTRSIERVCSTAALSVSQLDWTAGVKPAVAALLDIVPSMPCEIWLGPDASKGERIITGYVDADDIDTSEGSAYKLEVRSKVADLVDCTHRHATGVFRKMRVERIAQDLANAYGLNVLCETDTGAVVDLFRCEKTETVIKVIERLARERGLLLVDDTLGNLVITTVIEPSKPVAVLERGRNVISMSRRREVYQRYNHYVVRGQSADDFGAQGSLDDAWCRRDRTLCIDMEKVATKADCEKRMVWEASTRAGKSVRYDVTVPGWRIDPTDAESPLWTPNTLARLVDDVLGVDDDVLIVQTRHQKSAKAGTTTALSLGYPEGYTPFEKRYHKAPKGSKGKKAPAGVDFYPELRGGIQ